MTHLVLNEMGYIESCFWNDEDGAGWLSDNDIVIPTVSEEMWQELKKNSCFYRYINGNFILDQEALEENKKRLEKRAISERDKYYNTYKPLLCIAGSKSYGLENDDSDIDIIKVCPDYAREIPLFLMKEDSQKILEEHGLIGKPVDIFHVQHHHFISDIFYETVGRTDGAYILFSDFFFDKQDQSFFSSLNEQIIDSCALNMYKQMTLRNSEQLKIAEYKIPPKKIARNLLHLHWLQQYAKGKKFKDIYKVDPDTRKFLMAVKNEKLPEKEVSEAWRAATEENKKLEKIYLEHGNNEAQIAILKQQIEDYITL